MHIDDVLAMADRVLAGLHWYVVDAMGRCTLCAGADDALASARDAEVMWPRHAPHRAVQLVPADVAHALLAALRVALADRAGAPANCPPPPAVGSEPAGVHGPAAVVSQQAGLFFVC